MRLLLLAALLSGCTAVHAAQRLPLDPVARYVPPSAVPIPEPAPGDCVGRVELGPGESRDCVSVSVPPGFLVALQEALRLSREETGGALVDCYDGRDSDRAAMSEALDAVAADQRAIRAQALAAGCAACGSAASFLGAGVCAASRGR